MENVRAIKVILSSFELVSEIKINFEKSSFGAIGNSKSQVKPLSLLGD